MKPVELNLDSIATAQRLARAAVKPGEYLHSQRELYHVEQVNGERALVEDCRTGAIIETDVAQLLALEPVAAPQANTR